MYIEPTLIVPFCPDVGGGGGFLVQECIHRDNEHRAFPPQQRSGSPEVKRLKIEMYFFPHGEICQ